MNNLTFKTVSIATAALCGVLFLALLFVPQFLVATFSLEPSASAEAFGRRTAVIFAGLAVMSFHLRNNEHAPTIKAVSGGFVVMMGGLVVLGLVEFARGTVGAGIFLAVITELLFAVAYFRLFRAAQN